MEVSQYMTAPGSVLLRQVEGRQGLLHGGRMETAHYAGQERNEAGDVYGKEDGLGQFQTIDGLQDCLSGG